MDDGTALRGQADVPVIGGALSGASCGLLPSIPPKYSMANMVGSLKGKSAIRIDREVLGRQRTSTGYPA